MYCTLFVAIALAVLTFSILIVFVFDDGAVTASDPTIVWESSPTVDTSGTDGISTVASGNENRKIFGARMLKELSSLH